MKTYTITIEGTVAGSVCTNVYKGVKGFNRDNALLNLYRGCYVDPFIQERIITISEEK